MRANFALFGDIAIPNPLEDRPDRWSWVAEADRETREARPKYYWLNASAADPGSFGMNSSCRRSSFAAPRSKCS